MLKGWRDEPVETTETEGAMLQRACGELLWHEERRGDQRRGPPLLSREAWRRRRGPDPAEEKEEAKRNAEAARLWISGLEALKRKVGVRTVVRPVGHALLPARLGLRRRHAVPLDGQRLLPHGRHRVRHRQAAACARSPTTSPRAIRRSTATCGTISASELPKKGRAKPTTSTRCRAAAELQTALYALYSHYETGQRRLGAGRNRVPPVFIVVCNNTSTSKLVYEWIAGFERPLKMAGGA